VIFEKLDSGRGLSIDLGNFWLRILGVNWDASRIRNRMRLAFLWERFQRNKL
jgi:hypothetical protein